MDPAQPSEFGALLKRYRRAASLSQEALAERADLSARVVSDIERGVIQVPQRDAVTRLADALMLPCSRRPSAPRSHEPSPGDMARAPPSTPRGPPSPPGRTVSPPRGPS